MILTVTGSRREIDLKDVKDVCVVIQARLNSERVPQKMIRPFADSSLFEIGVKKILNSRIIPKENFYVSVGEPELVDIAEKHGVNVYHRSEKSANAENSILDIYEWHDQLPYKYVVLVSACNPLLKTETLDGLFERYLDKDSQGLFAVMAKKQYFWDADGNMIGEWPMDQKLMNTKTMRTTYEAAHCLYASRLDVVKDGFWMDDKIPPAPELYTIEEQEALDVDYEWQFHVCEAEYKRVANE